MNDLAATEQPSPVTGDVPVMPTVMMYLLDSGRGALAADLLARAEMGKDRYGTYLMAHNGRNAMADLYQELLDALMYLAQCSIEGNADVWQEFGQLKRLAMWAKSQLENAK